MAAAQLTDEELFSELNRLGFIPGPVTENTRPVYLKKLKKLRDEQQQRGTRSNKARNSGINTAAGASGFGARPASRDVTHLSTSSSPRGRPAVTEKRSVGGDKVVLGFSSDESDVEVGQKKGGLYHSGRRERVSGHRQSRPTAVPAAIRRNEGVGVSSSPGSVNSTPGRPEGRSGGLGDFWWGDEKLSVGVWQSIRYEGRDYKDTEDGDGCEVERDTRNLNGSRSSFTSNSSKSGVGDYSDSDSEGGERQHVRRLNSKRTQKSPSSHHTVGGAKSHQENTRVGVIRINDKSGAISLDVVGGKGEEEEEEEKKKSQGESVMSGAVENRNYSMRSNLSSGVMGESVRDYGDISPPAYNNHHVNSGGDDEDGSSTNSRFNIGIRPRYSAYSGLSQAYRRNHANHTSSNNSYNQTKPKLAVPEEDLLQQFKREEVSVTGGFSAHYLSMFLLTAACLFFVLLGLVYLRMRGASEVDVVVTKHPFGAEFDEAHNGGEKHTILKALLHLHVHLAKIAGEHDCGNHVHHSNRSVSLTAATEHLKLQSAVYEEFVPTALKWIIRTGQDVGIRLIGSDPEEPVTDVSEIIRLESTHPNMPFICRFRRAFFTVIHRVLLVIASIGIVCGVLYYMKYRWRREEEETRQMYDMVERIMDVLRSHSEACQDQRDLQPYLPIPHVRDSLVLPQERKKMRRVWERAEAFLSANESRVRTETQRVGGADFTVWRWIQPSLACDKLSAIPSKVWQGKAFPLDRRNSPPNSLTPCLKIRNMFDPVMEVGENWHLAIQEAILEKCSDNDGVVHIAVDKNSREGCVYVKCLSAEHSGKAFKALHGSWFDGKLVTVKYLRLDRYHQRFPSAQGCRTPLHASVKQMSSISPLRHRTTPACLRASS